MEASAGASAEAGGGRAATVGGGRDCGPDFSVVLRAIPADQPTSSTRPSHLQPGVPRGQWRRRGAGFGASKPAAQVSCPILDRLPCARPAGYGRQVGRFASFKAMVDECKKSFQVCLDWQKWNSFLLLLIICSV